MGAGDVFATSGAVAGGAMPPPPPMPMPTHPASAAPALENQGKRERERRVLWGSALPVLHRGGEFRSAWQVGPTR